MKMTAKTLAPVAIVAALGLGTLAPHAQTTPQKMGFVDVDKLQAAHPDNAAVVDITKKANTELDGLAKQIQAIDAKGTAVTAADKDKRTQLVATYQATGKTFQDQLKPKVDKINAAMDAAVSAVAKSSGYSVVMSRNVAATSGLVIYADENTDLTQAAIKALKP